MTLYDKMHSGEIYNSGDSELLAYQSRFVERLYDYNSLRPSQQKERDALLKEMFAEIGDDCYIEPPLRANWGGKHVHFGKHVYANFNLTLVDDTHIYVGDHTMIAPNVTIATAAHPLSAEEREKGMQYNLPVKIGKRCWIGAGAIILPGVTVGDDTVIGAGSVVTRDVPPYTFAAGNPCRVIRELTERDKEYYFRDMRADQVEW